MPTITIRKLDDALKSRLRIRVASHGRSMEEEAREILRMSLSVEPQQRLNLAESIRRKIEPLGGVDLEIPGRSSV